MSFRLFIYYCAMCGGCAAYLGWMLGQFITVENSLGQASLQGLFLGLTVALGLGLVDTLWNVSRQTFVVLMRVFVAVGVGSIGGLLGGFLSQVLYGRVQLEVFRVLGWTVTGLLIGASLGTFDFLSCLANDEDLHGAKRKLLNGILGGSLGGLLGSLLFLLIQMMWKRILGDIEGFWSPTATGFVALGVCIGLLIGLAQVILKEAWLKIEAGVRKGRELILERPEVTLGRAESCDLGLFGDPQIEKLHARINHEGNDFVLHDAGSASGTFVNDMAVNGPRRLRSGDLIRIGKCLVRFGERQKKQEEA
jgi:hypothetical protein